MQQVRASADDGGAASGSEEHPAFGSPEWRSRPAAVRERRHEHSMTLRCLLPALATDARQIGQPLGSHRFAHNVMQVSLPGSAREPGVWFVLAGFVKIAALTMSMGTSPFGWAAQHASCRAALWF